MNRKQIIVLWIGIAVIVVMGIYPPWTMKSVYANQLKGSDTDTIRSLMKFVNEVYYPIWPRPLKNNYLLFMEIDICKLVVQWIMVATITGGLLVTFKDKKKD